MVENHQPKISGKAPYKLGSAQRPIARSRDQVFEKKHPQRNDAKMLLEVTKLEKPALYMRVKAPALPATWIPLTCGTFWTQSCRARGHG
jgi:hypothetical protein